jgi:hypothetical protein
MKGQKKDAQAEGEKRLIAMGAEEVVAAEHAAEGKLPKPKAGKKR